MLLRKLHLPTKYGFSSKNKIHPIYKGNLKTHPLQKRKDCVSQDG